MQDLRKILFPFGWLYGGIVWLRNKFFDWKILSSKSYDFPVICVGNLSVGGTGKSPMIEYLIDLLKDKTQVATLSRGYKRKTEGFYLLNGEENASETGDEPLQFKTKFPKIHVAVDENRQHGIDKLCQLQPKPNVILLDDAFQHRKVTPNFSILLTAYDSLYKTDLMLPAGNLREPKSGANRANIVVVTKCPGNLSVEKQEKIKSKLKLKPSQSLYFSYIAYADFFTNGNKKISLNEIDRFCLVTGIAKPKPLVDHLKSKDLDFEHKRFPDHHNFSEKEIVSLRKEEIIITTEKDFMRLKGDLPKEKLFYLPIKTNFIGEKDKFDREILNFINNVIH